jgi:anti-sigma-K factor RskA
MSSLTPDRDLMAMEYALGLTAAEDMAQVSALLAADRAFAARVSHWQAQFQAIDDTAMAQTPPAALWQRVNSAIAVGASPSPGRTTHRTSRAKPSLWSSLPVWRGVAFGASMAAAILLALFIARPPSQPVLIAVLMADSGKAGAVIETFADGRVRLIPLQQIDVPEGRALQVWTLRDRNEGPISVGLIDQARTVRLDLGQLPLPGENQLFEITLEPETGSPTGKPTGPILMKGLTSGTL